MLSLEEVGRWCDGDGEAGLKDLRGDGDAIDILLLLMLWLSLMELVDKLFGGILGFSLGESKIGHKHTRQAAC